jgi:hypothetical protein
MMARDRAVMRGLLWIATGLAVALAGCGGGDGSDGQDEPICTPQTKKCDGNDIVKCDGDGSDWSFFKSCDVGCADGECKEAAPVCEFEVIKTATFALKAGQDAACGTWGTALVEFGPDADSDCAVQTYEEFPETCAVHASCVDAEPGMTSEIDYTTLDGNIAGTATVSVTTREGGVLTCSYNLTTEACKEGAVECDNDNRVLKCASDGNWDVVTECPDLCSDGACVAGRSGPCMVGESAGFTTVRIWDDEDNASLELPSCGGGSPGADIDAVCLYGPDDSEKACAATAVLFDWMVTDCSNDMDDPNQVLGAPDGIAQDGFNLGYFSLNGDAVDLTFGDGVEILCGDTIHVWEMYNPDVPGSVENYKVSLYSDDVLLNVESDYATGETDVEVSWDW